jgi:peptide/nickel transport system permease protein
MCIAAGISKSLRISAPTPTKTEGVAVGLRSFIAKRIVYSFMLVILIIMLNYLIFKLMPGSPLEYLMASWRRATSEVMTQQKKILTEMWGLNDPIYIQFVKYLRNLLSFNFGNTIQTGEPIASEMALRIPFTLMLLGGSTVISIILGLLLGVVAIQRRGGLFDSAAVTGSLVVGSLPTFWLGLMLILLFFSTLHLAPIAGARPVWIGKDFPVPWSYSSSGSASALSISFSLNILDGLKLVAGYLLHLFMPLLTLTIFSVGGWLLLTRATMLETITEDYVTTARAKGLKERTVLYKHALKNASLPLITSAALSFGFILSGAIITETVFTYPGLGTFTMDAISYLDYPTLMALFYIISLCVVIANIVADLLYGVIDPRIKYG